MFRLLGRYQKSSSSCFNKLYKQPALFDYVSLQPRKTTQSKATIYSFCRCGTRLLSKSYRYRRTHFPKDKYSQKSNNVSQNSSKWKDMERILTLAKPERFKIGVAVAFLLVSSSISISVPYFIGKLIDIMYTSSENHDQMMTTLWTTCAGLSIVFLIGAGANITRLYLIQTSGQNIIKNLRHKAFSAMISQEMATFDKSSSGELINRLSADTMLVGKAMTDNISDGMRACVQAIGGVSLMVYTSGKLTGFALMVVPPVVLVAVGYGRFLRALTKKTQDKLAESSQHAEERFSNMATVRAFAREGSEIDIYKSKVGEVYRLAEREALARAGFLGFNHYSGNIIALLVLYKGGEMMSESLISVGNLTSFLLYTVYVGISINGLGNFYTELMKGVGASTRIWNVIDKEPAIPLRGGANITDVITNEAISIKNVYFIYPTRPNFSILNNFSLHIPSGSVTAIVGESGSGKSTLVSLLLRYYDIQKGVIEIGGEDIVSFDPSTLRNYIGTVNQEPLLFSMSIRDNIAYGLPPDQQQQQQQNFDCIIDAAKRANAYDFITSFPDGFDTLVGARGQMLSGGQRQRIAIARAIVKNPKILLLDEATSALDSESEYLVQDALQNLMRTCTTIVIAHRLSTIKSANQIAVLKDGCVSEVGTYEDLMGLEDGAFKRLVEKQSFDR